MKASIDWREVDGELSPMVGDKRAVWAPLPGSQAAFLACPIFECLYTGTRGNGKTDALIMDFAQHVGEGYGAEWRGILFRQSYPQLADVIAKSKKWFHRIWPGARFNEAKTQWTWPGGETMLFRHMSKPDDYWSYHGHAYPWIGWEELTTWADPRCYTVMMACSRSTSRKMPRKYRATTNPYGVGHNWVKQRFNLPLPPGRVMGDVIEEVGKPARVAVHGYLQENKVLLHADPGYIDKVRGAARNPSELAAWLRGSWDIISGGMFDDLWRPDVHVVPVLPLSKIPFRWRIDRSYDHGQSKPFSVGWWAESNGEPWQVGDKKLGVVRGDLFRVAEWYGWNGNSNEGLRMTATDIALAILEREKDWGLTGRVRTGPADSSIFDSFEPGKSIAGDMQKVGLRWDPADKGPGSRKQGWEQIREWLRGALPPPGGPREVPGLFVSSRCDQFLRTVPVLPRSDKDLDDVDTDSEDHVGDELRYRLRAKRREVRTGRLK